MNDKTRIGFELEFQFTFINQIDCTWNVVYILINDEKMQFKIAKLKSYP